MQVFVPVSQCKDIHNFDKTNVFSKNICSLWCFLGIFGDRNRQKPNIFLKTRKENGWRCGRLAAFIVPTGPEVGRASRAQDLPEVALVLWSCVPLLYCSAPCALAANMALFRVFRAFLGGFMGFVWVCVVLVLCVACGAFVRVNS